MSCPTMNAASIETAASTQLTHSLAPKSPNKTSAMPHPFEPGVGNACFAELDARGLRVLGNSHAMKLAAPDDVDEPSRHLRLALELEENRRAARSLAHGKPAEPLAPTLETVLVRHEIG